MHMYSSFRFTIASILPHLLYLHIYVHTHTFYGYRVFVEDDEKVWGVENGDG